MATAKEEHKEAKEHSDSESKGFEVLTIPVTTIYKPTYANDFYKLPSDPIQHFADHGIHIGRCLGEGSFAAAYEGTYSKDAKLPAGKEKYLGKSFAVKVHHIGYHPYVPGVPNKDKIDPETQNELDLANRADVAHPNIVEFHFTALFPAQPKTVCDHAFIFMDKAMFPLQDLLNVMIRMRVQVPQNVGVRWIRGLIKGVHHLHSIGVVHGDIHTYNVFVFGDHHKQIGNDFRFRKIELKIADFGKCCDISKESEEGKASKVKKDTERLCIMFISMCDRIAFPEDVRKQAVDVFNQCYQQKISFTALLKSQPILSSDAAQDTHNWTILVTQ